MNKENKGFTLVELLGTLVIMSIIAFILIPKAYDSLKQGSTKLLKNQIKIIEKAALNYTIENPDVLDSYHLNPTFLSVETLKNEDYLDSKKILNPTTDEEMKGCVVVTYNTNTKSYDYKYEEEDCNDLKKNYEKIVAAYATILEKNPTVVSGDGLYEIDNEYVFRGKNPNNYLKIKQDLYRIISLNKDKKTIKVIKVTGESKTWEENTSSTDYSFRVATINTYLNSTFYNTLGDKVKEKIENNSTWNVGNVSGNKMNLQTLNSVEQSSIYNVNIGLLTLNEYARVSLNKTCSSDYLKDECALDNYLNFGSNYWLINNYNDVVWYVNNSGKISNTNTPKTALYKAHPVFNLVVNSEVSGSGTSTDPYVLLEK